MKKFCLSLGLLSAALVSVHAQDVLPASTPGVAAVAQYPALPSVTPDEFKAPEGEFDYVKRSVSIRIRR